MFEWPYKEICYYKLQFKVKEKNAKMSKFLSCLRKTLEWQKVVYESVSGILWLTIWYLKSIKDHKNFSFNTNVVPLHWYKWKTSCDLQWISDTKLLLKGSPIQNHNLLFRMAIIMKIFPSHEIISWCLKNCLCIARVKIISKYSLNSRLKPDHTWSKFEPL